MMKFFSFLFLITFLLFSFSFRRIHHENLVEEIIDDLLSDLHLPPEILSPQLIDYMPEFLAQHYKFRASSLGLDLKGYLEYLHEDREERIIQINVLKNAILKSLEEEFYSFFKFKAGIVREFLGRLIIEKINNNDYTINIKSVAGGIGMEGYSIAMILHDCLSQYAIGKLKLHGEEIDKWIDKWQINISVLDISLLALLEAKLGRYRRVDVYEAFELIDYDELERTGYERQLLERYLEPVFGEPDLLKVKDKLKSWIKPSYIDLTDREEIKRLRLSPAELILFILPSIKREEKEIVKPILKSSFNPNYSGLYFDSPVDYEIINLH